jgi:plastocyanin
VILAGAVMLAAGCQAGGSTPGFTFAPPPGASTSASPSNSASGSTSGSTITLSLKEYSITPATVTLKAGTPVTFEARNDGTISHALVISGAGVNLTTKDLAFQSGTSETISATLAAGTYTFICPVDGHAAQGMKGTITVTP